MSVSKTHYALKTLPTELPNGVIVPWSLHDTEKEQII